jgi:selenocysteine-specific elongation factor
MIVGTAGHIDHGKTSLVKALTGVDTDRLKEEKARGISIELGYAYQPLPDGSVLGFVDVPGHQKFVDHMVAGATGIDFVLLVVAADDGPMPQTMEHLDIVGLLGVRDGAIAMTKTDRVDDGRHDACEREIRALVAASPLAEAPIFRVSSVTGDGLAQLSDYLAREAARTSAQRPGAGFRLAVDRCFTLDGVGTVVTGTVFSGEIRVGDEVVATPSGRSARVRSLHAQNRTAMQGRAGERCALALAGIAKSEIGRGEWIAQPRLHAPTNRLDVDFTVSRREGRPVRHWTSVHLHLGAAHVLARIALLEGETLAPGDTALAQIVTEQPVGALAGDAFIVRDASGSRTLGGGRVLDPRGRERRRRAMERLEVLRRLRAPSPNARLQALLAIAEGGVDFGRFAIDHNATPDELDAGPGAVRVARHGVDIVFGASAWDGLRERLVARLARYHDEHPDETGPDLGRMRRMEFPRHEPAVVEALAAQLLDQGAIACSGPWWHLPRHTIRLTAREEILAQKILPRLDAEAFAAPWVKDIAYMQNVPEKEIRMLMRRLGGRGDVFAIVKDLYYTRATVARMAQLAREIEASHGAVRAAVFRDRLGVGRKRAILILEFFDRVGFTRRYGDEHRVRSDSLLASRIGDDDALRKGFVPGGAAGLQTR